MPEHEYYDNACINMVDNCEENDDEECTQMNHRKTRVYDELRREKDALMRNMYTIDKNVVVEKTDRWGGIKRVKKNMKITYFSSGNNGSYIRDAVTGIATRYRVGSVQEHQFFTVSMSANNQYTKCPIGYDSGAVKLFYSSPVEFEKHQFESVSEIIRSSWYAKQM